MRRGGGWGESREVWWGALVARGGGVARSAMTRPLLTTVERDTLRSVAASAAATGTAPTFWALSTGVQ